MSANYEYYEKTVRNTPKPYDAKYLQQNDLKKSYSHSNACMFRSDIVFCISSIALDFGLLLIFDAVTLEHV